MFFERSDFTQNVKINLDTRTDNGQKKGPEGNNTKFLGRRTLAEGRPTSQKGTIQIFFGKEDAGGRPANKPVGNNTKLALRKE